MTLKGSWNVKRRGSTLVLKGLGPTNCAIPLQCAKLFSPSEVVEGVYLQIHALEIAEGILSNDANTESPSGLR